MSAARLAVSAAVSRANMWIILPVVVCCMCGTREVRADDDTIVDDRPAHWYTPPGFGGRLVAYDLTTACDENARKRNAGMPYNTACFMLRDFVAAYHPGVKFSWQRPTGRHSCFVGTALHADGSRDEVFVRWQSLSDGLQWGFGETRLTRQSDADPFSVIADAAVRRDIREATGIDTAARRCDVFLVRTRDVVADDRADGLRFLSARQSDGRYGVVVDGSVKFFDLPPSAIPVFKLGIYPQTDQPCAVAEA
jgi:hypothetical protein